MPLGDVYREPISFVIYQLARALQMTMPSEVDKVEDEREVKKSCIYLNLRPPHQSPISDYRVITLNPLIKLARIFEKEALAGGWHTGHGL